MVQKAPYSSAGKQLRSGSGQKGKVTLHLGRGAAKRPMWDTFCQEMAAGPSLYPFLTVHRQTRGRAQKQNARCYCWNEAGKELPKISESSLESWDE